MDDVYNIKEWEGDLVDSDPILLSFKISTCLHVFFFRNIPTYRPKPVFPLIICVLVFVLRLSFGSKPILNSSFLQSWKTLKGLLFYKTKEFVSPPPHIHLSLYRFVFDDYCLKRRKEDGCIQMNFFFSPP